MNSNVVHGESTRGGGEAESRDTRRERRSMEQIQKRKGNILLETSKKGKRGEGEEHGERKRKGGDRVRGERKDLRVQAPLWGPKHRYSADHLGKEWQISSTKLSELLHRET